MTYLNVFALYLLKRQVDLSDEETFLSMRKRGSVVVNYPLERSGVTGTFKTIQPHVQTLIMYHEKVALSYLPSIESGTHFRSILLLINRA